MMAGELSFFEIPAADAQRAQTFYGSLFGWQFASGNIADYFMIPNATPLAGLSGNDTSPHPRLFFSVEDIAVGVAHVRQLGGEADEPVQIPSGWFARCRDDQGTHFTLWQDAA